MLDSKSFPVGVFGSLNRPIVVNLNGNKDLNILDKNIFKSFLDLNGSNQIYVNILDCNDCKSYWLLDNGSYKGRLDHIVCSNANPVTSSKNFPTCGAKFFQY